MILYISGPISSDMDGYKSRFGKVESVLKLRGHIVLNPAVHPLGMPYEAYLKIDMAMVDVSDGIVMLHGWHHSNGARRELKHALRMGKKVFYGIESVPMEVSA